MKIHIHVIPIDLPGHLDPVPDPPLVWHYTTGANLDLILRSGAIVPTTAKVPPHEKPVAWFSTSDEWEVTATKVPVPGKVGQLMTAQALACLGNPDPVGMKVYAPVGEETFDDIQTTEEAQAGADRREAA